MSGDGYRSAGVLDAGVKAEQVVPAGELRDERGVRRRVQERVLWSCGEVLGGRQRCVPCCGELMRMVSKVGMVMACSGILAA